MSSSLDRQASCPSCGAPITFKFAGARSQICQFCRAVVARTGGGVQMTGRMAELLEINSPLQVGAEGQWNGEQCSVDGRIQMDRVNAPSAPWQEMLVTFPMSGRSTWVAFAQGRWYATSDIPPEATPALPPANSLQPGSHVDLGQHGAWVVAEIGQRKVVSGEGAMTMVPAPGLPTFYADISSGGGQFGTIDYGDGTAAPVLYLGRQFDSREIQLSDGMPLDAPQSEVKSLNCPNCGGDLPILSQQSERVVCQYCGTASDIQSNGLQALGPSPPPPMQPYLPIGAPGQIRGNAYTVCGFMVRSCIVEGVRYAWREYLLFGGEHLGYRWIGEEDGNWTFVEPVEAGAVHDGGNAVVFNNANYGWKQTVQAAVEYVVGEFYWKVAIGETVEATEFAGMGGKFKVSREKSATEVNYSAISPLDPQELASFGVAAPTALSGDGDSSAGSNIVVIIVIILIICFLCFVMSQCGGGTGGGYGSSGGWSK